MAQILKKVLDVVTLYSKWCVCVCVCIVTSYSKCAGAMTFENFFFVPYRGKQQKRAACARAPPAPLGVCVASAPAVSERKRARARKRERLSGTILRNARLTHILKNNCPTILPFNVQSLCSGLLKKSCRARPSLAHAHLSQVLCIKVARGRSVNLEHRITLRGVPSILRNE